ncbi:MAG: hypothetical protein ACOCXZ_02000 [Chloroflexota bacterium]
MRLTLDLLLLNKRLRDAVLVVCAGLMVLLYLSVGVGGFPLDDSWIHQVYARNLAERGEWAFVPGEPSGASTAPLYTLLLAAGYALNIDYRLWTHLLGFLALAIAALLAARLIDRAANVTDLVERVLPGWFGGLTVVFSWHLIWAAVSGMETLLFAMLTLAFIWLTWRELDSGRSAQPRDAGWRGAAIGMITALMVATRPEGALLGAVGAGLMLLAYPQHDRRVLFALGGGAALAFALTITPYLLLNLSLNGAPLPNTSEAKFAQHVPLLAQPYTERLLDMKLPLLVGGLALLVPGVVVYGLVMISRGLTVNREAWLWLLPLAWAAALIMLYAARLPAAYQHGRYVMPALPALLIIGVVGTDWLLTRTRGLPGVRVLPLTLAFAAALTVLYFAVGQGPLIYRADQRVIEDEMVAQAQWIRDNLPPDALLAVHDIGAVGYFAPRRIIDIAGLVTPEATDRIGDAEALWALMQDRRADYLMAFPDQIPGQNPDDPRLCFVHDSPGTGSTDLGGPKMTIYRIAWDENCADQTP